MSKYKQKKAEPNLSNKLPQIRFPDCNIFNLLKFVGLEVYGDLQGCKAVSKKCFEVHTHTLTTSSFYVMSDSYSKVLFHDGSGRVGWVFVEINTNSARLGLGL